MLVEIPECKRCCCCIPLRYGLIAWGYLKLLLVILALISLSISLAVLMEWPAYRPNTSTMVMYCLTIVLFTIDITSSVMFIVGCHMKSVKLMKIFYFYSMFPLTLTVLLNLFVWYTLIQGLIKMSKYHSAFAIYRSLYLFTMGIAMLSYIGIQVYILLLVRSEIIKLKAGCQFRFVNNAAEAECTLHVVQQNEMKILENDNTEIIESENDEMKIYT